jgi:hypothetical protein
MNNTEKALFDALINALTLNWTDNGNIMAEAVRDSCLGVIAETLGIEVQGVQTMIDKKISDQQ